MAHFAEIRSDNKKVIRVLVVGDDQCQSHGGQDSAECEQWVKDFHPIDQTVLQENGGVYPETFWKRTSFNTKGNQHENGGIPFRKNYAGVGYTYDSDKDAFISPKPRSNDGSVEFSSWVLNEDTCLWDPPVNYPSIKTYGDGIYYDMVWDETNTKWLGYDADNNEFEWNPANSSWFATGN